MSKRLLFLSCAIFVLVAITANSLPARAQNSGITYPPETEVIAGVIQITGTAQHPEFWKYELAAAPSGTQNWFNIAVSESPVQSGVLGVWDTRTVPDGTYTLRLRVVRRDGNYDEYQVRRTQVGNSQPTPTPTPAESPTATVTPTIDPPTATPVVLTPEIPTPTPGPTDIPESEEDLVASGEDLDDGEGEQDSVSTLLNRASSGFQRGARTVLIIFLVVGFFFLVKYILTWLYYRFLV